MLYCMWRDRLNRLLWETLPPASVSGSRVLIMAAAVSFYTFGLERAVEVVLLGDQPLDALITFNRELSSAPKLVLLPWAQWRKLQQVWRRDKQVRHPVQASSNLAIWVSR